MILTLVGISYGTLDETARRARGVGADIVVLTSNSKKLSQIYLKVDDPNGVPEARRALHSGRLSQSKKSESGLLGKEAGLLAHGYTF
jgi:hypothetical protein